MTARGISLKVAAEQWVPWTKVTSMPDGNTTLGGPTGKLMEVLAKVMMFEYELVRPPDGLWGAEQPDKSWSGMMGMVYREVGGTVAPVAVQTREVEFALGPFTITPQREAVSDFAIPLASENQAIIMQRPRQETDMGGFLKAFTTEVRRWCSIFFRCRILQVWLLTALSVAAISSATILLVRAESRVFGRTIKNITSHSMLWVVKALTQEGKLR
ncbi:Glutamate receptor ionotropic, delta-1 [Portunus trituberculatus]|uniref:Glutamate receptor ionotropic, delta-1 n=1 Tax=Portunus trituberculatus TaxID=210409 RepID=A0A5B7EGP3_PORTR|nr:Glutamate receptor ionotropic, delta-1 [Portunus trituberculatus]